MRQSASQNRKGNEGRDKKNVRYVGCDRHGHVTDVSVITFKVPVSSLYTKSMSISTGDRLVLAVTTSDRYGYVLLKPTILQPGGGRISHKIIVLNSHQSVEQQDILQSQIDGTLRTKEKSAGRQ